VIQGIRNIADTSFCSIPTTGRRLLPDSGMKDFHWRPGRTETPSHQNLNPSRGPRSAPLSPSLVTPAPTVLTGPAQYLFNSILIRSFLQASLPANLYNPSNPSFPAVIKCHGVIKKAGTVRVPQSCTPSAKAIPTLPVSSPRKPSNENPFHKRQVVRRDDLPQ
jgi:hypothetical protein